MNRAENRDKPPVKVEIKEGKATTASSRAWALLWQRLLGDKGEKGNHGRN